MKQREMQRAIFSCLSILDAWKKGRIRISIDKDNAQEHQYSLTTIMNVLENNLLEGVHEPTQLIKKGRDSYEIFESV